MMPLTSWKITKLHLNLEQNLFSRYTKIIYMEDMTDGIDKGYDAGFIIDENHLISS